MKRVVITGIGAVTPLGNTFQDSWQAASEGQSGIGPTTKVMTSDIAWKVSGELKKFDPGLFLSPKEILRLDAFAQYALASALMAAEDAGLFSPNVPQVTHPSSLHQGGVIIGSGRGGIGTLEKAIINQQSAISSQRKILRLSPYLMPSTTISMAASYTAQKLGLMGYCLGISNACASGSNAIGEAFSLIRGGFAGPVFAGGADAPVCRICLEGYGSAKALSKKTDCSASRPFHKLRDGFVLSEGSAVIVLEEYEAAVKRGARIYAEIIGYGNSVDAFHQTLPSVKGEVLAINRALSQAGIAPEEVNLISSHGTSTQAGDLAECRAIHQVFGKNADRIPVTAMKSMTGHMLAASGVFETACTAMILQQGRLFPTINLSEQDENIQLSVVTKARQENITIALVNSFGFGGVNAVLALKKVKTGG